VLIQGFDDVVVVWYSECSGGGSPVVIFINVFIFKPFAKGVFAKRKPFLFDRPPRNVAVLAVFGEVSATKNIRRSSAENS
jgi:hypothetical protein